jgi:hypothetical protein
MPIGDVSVANIGTPVPLSYGFFRATGMRLIDFTVAPTIAVPLGTFPAGLQIGFWDLGEGELDGCDALWIDDTLQFALDSSGSLMGASLVGVTAPDPTTTPTLSSFFFHPGCDAPLLGYSGPSTPQEYDVLWGYLGSLATALCYSRRAYYTIGWTPPTTASTTMSPVADFRGMRCRIFDSLGNQTAYIFTTNPIWHAVDLWLRRAIKPDYAIDPFTGPTALTAEEAACFNWPSIYAAAQYCDATLANGQPRFSGSYVFASGSTLASMLEQVFLCCRGYQIEYAGQIYMFCDQPRDSTFIVSAKHLVPSSFAADDAEVNQAPNRYIAQFLELGLPAVAQIDTIVRTTTNVQINTVYPNPAAPGDIISVGGVTDDSFDSNYLVATTPSDTEIDSTITGGSAASSTGGWIGYIQSRFSQRTPEISHLQHQIALGQILPPAVTGTRLKRIKVTYDFASMTYDQAMRLLQYEVYRELGLDYLNPTLLQQVFGNLDLLGAPWLPPFGLTLSLYSESVDVNGSALKAQLQGDIITLDPSVFYEFAGDYEIIERYINPIQQEIEDSTDGSFVSPTTRSGALASGTDQNSGILKLVLRTFNRSAGIFTDVSVAPSASFQTVPGQLPYGGGESGGAGFVATAGSFTVTTEAGTEFTNISEVVWTAISVRLGTGITLLYAAGNTGGFTLIGPDSGYYLYVDDPGLIGAGSIFVSHGPPTPGPGIMVLYGPFSTLPPNGVGFPDASYTVSF